MTRQLVVWCPDWPVVASGVAPDAAVAVLRGHEVLAASRAAAGEGVHAGLRRREAQARCPSLVLVDHDPARDARHFEPVVHALSELVAASEVSEPGTLLFGTRGPSRWCGGDIALATRTYALVAAALGERAGLLPGIGVGVADGRFAAMVAARHSVSTGTPHVVEPGRHATAAGLAPVTVAVLREIAGASPALVDLLARLGITTLGLLAALPATDVLARFGNEGAFVHALASGRDGRPPGAVEPAPELAVSAAFDDPVDTLGPLVFTAKQLAEELHLRLATRGQTCTRLLVEAETDHGERTERNWHRSDGLTAAAMVERVRWQLEGWIETGLTSGVVLLRLAPHEARADHGRQLGFWGEATQADEFAARVIARVSGLLGAEAVTVPEWQGGRDPVARYRWVSAAGADVADAAARRRALVAPDLHPWPGAISAPSPAWVAARPEPVEVLDADGHHVTVDGRGTFSAEPVVVRHPALGAARLTAWAGPWPAEERWWDPQRRRRRARFQLLTESSTALLVSLENGTWWLEAKYE